MSKVYKHEYECKRCDEVDGHPGCKITLMAKSKEPWPPTSCPYEMYKNTPYYPYCKWIESSIEEVKND